MKLPKILFKGLLTQSKIKVVSENTIFRLDNNYQIVIDRTWKTLIEMSQKNNRLVWNSMTYRLKSHGYSVGQLVLTLELVEYKTRIGIKENSGIIKQLIPELYPNGIFVASVVKTSDGKYVMIVPTKETLNSNAIDFVGGTLSKDELEVSISADIFSALNKELLEEISIKFENIKSQKLIGIIQNEVTQVGLYFITELNLNSSHISSNRNKEIKSVLVVSPVEFRKIVGNMKLSKKMVLELIQDL